MAPTPYWRSTLELHLNCCWPTLALGIICLLLLQRCHLIGLPRLILQLVFLLGSPRDPSADGSCSKEVLQYGYAFGPLSELLQSPVI